LLFLFSLVAITGCGTPELFRNVYAEKQSGSYFFSDMFVPETITNTYRMRDFITSDYFTNYKHSNGDLKAIDEMYDYALWLTDEDIPQSLFIISLATLPYKRTPAKIPVIKFDMMFYFSMESDSSFKKRFHNLPAHFFSDSPENSFGDKDKMPHYFGSAFISYTSDTKFLSKYIGDLIETGEAFFSLEGFYDERDRKTNDLGAQFGSRLLKYPNTKPSEYILKWKK
jgi:hypothetical protein